MAPLRLTDEQLTAIMSAARPLEVTARNSFLQEVAQRLTALPHLGDGIVHRVVAEVQKRHFDPPLNEPGPPPRKYETPKVA
jgi:hypothetical protein